MIDFRFVIEAIQAIIRIYRKVGFMVWLFTPAVCVKTLGSCHMGGFLWPCDSLPIILVNVSHCQEDYILCIQIRQVKRAKH